MLDKYRVIDLTDRRGWMTGFLLAQLGADVISVSYTHLTLPTKA